MTAVADVLPVERALGRNLLGIPVAPALDELQHDRVLVTGAAGSIGSQVASVLAESGVPMLATDIEEMNVLDFAALSWCVRDFKPTVVLHLAGAKHAPDGELDPWAVTETNVIGTRNVLDVAGRVGARVVTASTCKAADPETAYGASKLLAERMTLNAGGTVARFYNVVESAGNVFEAWAALDSDEPLSVTGCARYLMALEEAVALMLWAAILPSGRYAVRPGERRLMSDVAESLYPGRKQRAMDVRRGDRIAEPISARSEICEGADWMPRQIVRVKSPHDPGASR